MEKLLQPIGRRNYVVGILVITLSQAFLAMLLLGGTAGPKIFFGAGGIPSEQSIIYFIPITLFFFMIRVGWDFKRLKDISGGSTWYYYLLLIPVMKTLSDLWLLFKENLSVEPSFGIPIGAIPAFLFLGIFSFLSLVYYLFLIFKKGTRPTAFLAQSPQTTPSP